MRKLHYSLFFVCLFGFYSLKAQSLSQALSSNCLQAEKNFYYRFNALVADYKKLDPNTKISKQDKPSWSWGQNQQAVYLLHGFIGTPYEMSFVGELLKKEGFTVINDLIPGHGATGAIANNYAQKEFRLHVENNLDDLRQCFTKIHFVGFSTGGLLIHDYLAKNKDAFSAQSVTFYSPFYQPHYFFANWVSFWMKHVTPTVPANFVYQTTGFPDVKVAIAQPEHYLQDVPVRMAYAIMSLGAEVYHFKPQVMKNTPALLFVARGDRVDDIQATQDKVQEDFLKTQVIIFDQNTPHHLMVSDVSPVAESVWVQTKDFILKNR